MANEGVHASPNDVRKLATALTIYSAEVADATKKVRAALNQANWHDGRKQQFEQRYQDFQKRMNGFLGSEVDEMVRSLNQLAARLDDVRETRL